MKNFVQILVLVLFAFNMNAQKLSERTWQDLVSDPSSNFFETQAKFNEYWKGRPITQGSGYKAFKRYEWYMEPRVDKRGNKPAPDAVMRAMKESPKMFKNATATGVWSYIGNTSVPSGGGGAGRINGVRELPGSTTTFFACAPGGGLWKTTDSGTSWSMLGTDFLASIGASDVAIDPTNTNIMYLATGDCDAGDTKALGVLKSTDGGNTWNTTGLNWSVTLTRTTSRILINPSNTQIVICATSNGIYRTTDGGVNWTQTVAGNFKDLSMKPGDSNTWYASSNQLFKSIDGGVTWTQLTTGLPASTSAQRMSIATTAADANVVYVLASGNDSGLLGVWKSIDNGATFTQMTGTSPNYLNWDTSATATTGGQGWYDLRIAADPTNANTIVIGGVNVWKSTNGGANYTLIGHWYGGGGAPYVHADIHAIHFVPNSSRLLIGNDGGVFMTSNGGTSFSDISSNLPIAQIYRLSVAGTNNNVVISGWQDNGTNLKNGSTHTRPLGGDGMDCQINASNASIMYGELYYGAISKSTNGGASFSQIVGSGGTGVNEDGAWVTPYVLGPNPNHIFVGKSLVFKSLDGGSTFTASAAFGGTTDCNYIAVAPSNSNIVYASKGSALYKSIDNAATFTQVNGMQGSYITSFCIHNTDPNKVWVSYSNYTAGQKLYYTADGGTTWTNISGSLPNLPANVVVYQPNTSNGIYVGMDAGVYFRDDILGNFVPYFNALPNAEVFDLDIQLSTNTITACTYGRGIWRAPLYVLPALDGVMSAIVSPTGTLCSSSVTPVIQILNAGTTTLTSMSISYQISGQAAQSYTWSGTLATGASQNITLPTVNYGNGAFTFTANILSVNGGTDENATNNSLTSSYYCVNGVNNATLTLETDCYPGETSWQIRDASNNIVHSGAGYASETIVNIPVCLATECYTFVINDSYGDGISGSGCSQGAGNYFIKDNLTQTTLVTMTNASFGTSASHNFCYPIGQVLGCTNPTACNYNSLATQSDNSCTFGPVNDLCSGAIALTVNAAATSGSNVSACIQGTNPTCGGATQIKDVWYKFVFQGGPVTISTNFTGGTLSDTRLAVYSSCGGTQIACNDDIASTNYKSSITLTCAQLTLGQTYFIQAGGYNATTGTFFIQITAPIEICNGTDDNCNGQIDEGFDADGDGYTTCGGDCNDNNAAIRPNATETCNGIDDNCNSTVDEGVLITFYQDSDGDGYGNASVTTSACSAPTGYVSNSTDCNDNNAAIRPNATETCNGIDDNCNSTVDEGVLITFYQDSDGDGYGNASVTTSACSAPTGYVSNSTDCNDNNAAIRPNATETCNGIDDNCNSTVDEGVLVTFYQDSDGDGYGNASVTTSACSAPTGYVSNSTDCNDNNAAIRPNATETCNGIDDNCNSTVDEGALVTFYQDSDGDGYGNASVTTSACSAPTGYVSNSTDCNDNNAAIRPNATETCNGIDDNCNSTIDEGVLITFYRDQDGDGYGNASVTTSACSAPTGYVSNSTDCNDNNAAIRPNATETCNGIDDNCNSTVDEGVLITFYQDSDGDGYGNASVTTSACSAPTGYVSNSTDCNDNNSSVNPAAIEICTNSIDDNCNNQINENCCALVLSAVVANTSCTAAVNGSIDLSVSGGTTYTYAWSNGATTQDIQNLAAGTYTVTVTSGGCTQTGSYTVGNSNSTGPAAPASISGPAGVCRNSTGQVFSTPAISGATSYTWTLPNGATGTSTTNSITLSFSSNYNTGNLCVRAVNACGQSASFCRSVTAYTSNPATPGTISGPSTNACAGTTQTYSIAAVTNATSYTWTAPANATITSGQGTSTVTVSFSSLFTSSGTLSVRSVNCFGQSSNRTLTIYSIPATPGTITGSVNNLCPGNYTYTIAAVAGASSYTWTAPLNTTIASGQGTNSISLTVSSSFTSGTLSVRANSSCGQSALRSTTISKSPATPSTISGQTTNLCGGGQFTYSITAVTGATSYSWSVPAGCSIVTNNGTSITLSITSAFTSGTLSVTASNSCGGTSTRSTTLTRVPATPASITGPATACPNQTGLVFTTPAVTGITQTWTVPTGAVITAGQGTTSMTCTWGTATGSVSVRNVNSCGQSTARTKSVAIATCMEMVDESSDDVQPIREEENAVMNLEVYPNPNLGTFTIQSPQSGIYKLLSSTGQLVYEIQLNESNNYSFEVEGLSSGLYFLQGLVGSSITQQKVIVSNR